MPNSITITCPNPAVLSRLQADITKLLKAYEKTLSDAHLKRGAMLATISNETVLNDAACKAIADVIQIAECEAASLDHACHRDGETQLSKEADAAGGAIELARAIISA